jgi:hypothetical protein
LHSLDASLLLLLHRRLNNEVDAVAQLFVHEADKSPAMEDTFDCRTRKLELPFEGVNHLQDAVLLRLWNWKLDPDGRLAQTKNF